MKIKKNYIRKTQEEEVNRANYQKCPNCKQEILKTDWRNHFKICVMDSKWKDQKQQRIERQNLNSLATGEEITQNLRRFANQRPDLYGKAPEEVA
jgi:acetyl-CoA carboxylase beta subunit